MMIYSQVLPLMSILQILEKVLQILKTAGLHQNCSKCLFLQPKIDYLGYIIDQNGIHPTEEKVRAIKEAPDPYNVTELCSFLGIINYYNKFLVGKAISSLYPAQQEAAMVLRSTTKTNLQPAKESPSGLL